MLYDDKADGIISATEFIMLKNKYQNDINNFNLRIEAINKEIYDIRDKENNAINEKSVLEKYTHLEKLSRFVISTYDRTTKSYKKIASFSSKFVARWEYFSKVVNKEYTNLYLIDAEKGKVLHKYGDISE